MEPEIPFHFGGVRVPSEHQDGGRLRDLASLGTVSPGTGGAAGLMLEVGTRATGEDAAKSTT